MKIAGRLASAGAATAVLAASLILGASPASAATSPAVLSFFSGGCAGGLVGLQATGSIDSGFGSITSLSLDFFGADTFSDDHLIGPIAVLNASGGINYVAQVCLSSSTLNEDIGQDEVYAIVGIATSSGSGLRLKTNEITHSF